MSKTLVDIDEALLAEATVALGTSTKKETLTRALEYAVEDRRARREHALAELQRIAREGGFHFDQLEELDR